MAFTLSMLFKSDSAQAKADLRALQGEVAKTGAGAKTLDAAGKTGAAGIGALGRSADKTEADLLGLAAAQKSVAASGTTMTRTNTMAAGSVGNLVAQFNDVGMMLAAGQNPLMLAVQQGSQISQVIGPMGAAGAVKALGAAFMGMLNPVNLVVMGSIAGLALVTQWLFSTGEEAGTFGDRVEGLADGIDRYGNSAEKARSTSADLRKEFGAGAEAARKYYLEIVELDRREAERQARAAAESIRAEIAPVTFMKSGQRNLADFFDLSVWSRDAQRAFNPVLDAFRAIEQADGIDAQIAALETLRDRFIAAAEASGSMSVNEEAALRQINSLLLEQQRLRGAIQDDNNQRTEDNGRFATALEVENNLIAEQLARREALADATELLRDLLIEAAGVNLSGVFDSALGSADALLGKVGAILSGVRAAAGEYAAAQGQLAQMAVEFSPGGQALLAYGNRGAPTPAQRALETRNIPRSTGGTGAGAGGGGGAAAERDAVAELIERLREEQQLMIEMDPVREELAKHRKVLAETTAGERAEIEQLIAAEVQLQAAREAADFFGDASLDFLQGIVSGSESAADAVKKLLSSLLDASIQALWLGQGPLAGLFGISGGIFSGLFGGGRGGGGTQGLPLLAGGGMIYGAGGGTADRVPVMMSAGEFAVNARSTARYRPVLERINAGADLPGYAAGGLIGGSAGGFAGGAGRAGPLALHVHINGAAGDKEIEARVVAGVAAGLEMFSRERLPHEVKRIQRQGGRVTG